MFIHKKYKDEEDSFNNIIKFLKLYLYTDTPYLYNKPQLMYKNSI